MYDPVDIRQRVDALARRLAARSDYGTLLARGEVWRLEAHLDDVDAWREALQREAQADCIPIDTGREHGIVWAALRDNQREDPDEGLLGPMLACVVPQAVQRGHEPEIALGDHAEMVCICERCAAEGYISAEEAFAAGDLFEVACPFDSPPALTALALNYGRNRTRGE